MKSNDKFVNRINKLAQAVLSVISVGILLGINILNFRYTTFVEYNQNELVHVERQRSYVYLLLCIIIVAIFMWVCRKSEKWFHEKWLYGIFAGAYMVDGIFLIMNLDGTLRDDAKFVHDAAVEFSQGNYRELMEGGYIFRKAHQLGLVTYERVLGILTFDTKFIFLINLLLINGINFLSYKISNIVFEQNRKVNFLTIILSYLFLPQFFFLIFAYGLVVGFFFLMLAFFCMEHYFRYEDKKSAIVGLVAITIASIMKTNYLIGGITIGILCILRFFQKKKLILLLLALSMVIIPVGALKAIPMLYHWETGLDINEGEPMILYVVMGINPSNYKIGPGWYNGSNWVWYEQAGFDNEKAIERAEESIQSYFEMYRDAPVETIKFFVRKTASMWCEPMFQSVWSGPMESTGQVVKTSFLQSLYKGETVENYICLYMKAYLTVIWLFALFYIPFRKQKDLAMGYAYIFFVGGFLFHLLWEGKSQYIYPYVYVLLPACAKAVVVVYEKIAKELINNVQKQKNNT